MEVIDGWSRRTRSKLRIQRCYVCSFSEETLRISYFSVWNGRADGLVFVKKWPVSSCIGFQSAMSTLDAPPGRGRLEPSASGEVMALEVISGSRVENLANPRPTGGPWRVFRDSATLYRCHLVRVTLPRGNCPTPNYRPRPMLYRLIRKHAPCAGA